LTNAAENFVWPSSSVRQAVPPRCSSGYSRANQNIQEFTRPEAQRLTRQAKNAWPTGANDLNFSAAAKTDFLDSLDLLGPADDLYNLANFASLQTVERNQLVHVTTFTASALTVIETQSHLFD
jgi:hypothetical protein